LATVLIRGSRILTPEPGEADAILVEGERIAEVGRWSDLSAAASTAVLDLRGFTLLPGLIDTHLHITGSGTRTAPQDRRTEPRETQLLRAAGNAWRLLAEGVTTVRDVGARSDVIFPFRDAVRRGALPAPRILASGSPLTRTGGHGFFWGGEVDTTDEARRLVRTLSKLGADSIKIMVDGTLDQGGRARPGLLMFSSSDLRAIVEEAEDWGLPVLAHCLSLGGARVAVEAGVHSLEHLWMFDANAGRSIYDNDLIDRIVRAGIWVNPSQTWAYEAMASADVAEPFSRNVELFNIRLEYLARMKQAGVHMVAGTDAGTYATPFGLYWLAPKLFVDHGQMSPVEAIRACTIDAAAAMRVSGETGALGRGLSADLIAVDGDPSTDISALQRVVVTMLQGRVLVDRRGTTPLGHDQARSQE
jgi:imidazolonepropionase-like amidohydrolase